MASPIASAENAVDLGLTLTGDLDVGSDGDLVLVSGLAALQQNIIFRLKTQLGDYAYEPQCGTELEALMGLPSSQPTANQGEASIRTALTHDSLIDNGGLDVYAWPEGDALVYTLLIDPSLYGYADGDAVSLTLTVDPKEGLLL